MSAAKSVSEREKEKERNRESRRSLRDGRTSLGPVARRWNGRTYPRSDSKLIFLSWADRDCDLSKKNRGRLCRAFLSRFLFSFLFLLLRLYFLDSFLSLCLCHSLFKEKLEIQQWPSEVCVIFITFFIFLYYTFCHFYNIV